MIFLDTMATDYTAYTNCLCYLQGDLKQHKHSIDWENQWYNIISSCKRKSKSSKIYAWV